MASDWSQANGRRRRAQLCVFWPSQATATLALPNAVFGEFSAIGSAGLKLTAVFLRPTLGMRSAVRMDMAELAPLFRTYPSRVTRLCAHRALEVLPMTNHLVVLKAADPRTISRRVLVLRDALVNRGGEIRYLDWAYSPGRQEHSAIVHYSLPTDLYQNGIEPDSWQTS